jgi:hypothetical protein
MSKTTTEKYGKPTYVLHTSIDANPGDVSIRRNTTLWQDVRGAAALEAFRRPYRKLTEQQKTSVWFQINTTRDSDNELSSALRERINKTPRLGGHRVSR